MDVKPTPRVDNVAAQYRRVAPARPAPEVAAAAAEAKVAAAVAQATRAAPAKPVQEAPRMVRAELMVDERTGRVIGRRIDARTGEVILQVPSDALLSLFARSADLLETVGAVIDDEV